MAKFITVKSKSDGGIEMYSMKEVLAGSCDCRECDYGNKLIDKVILNDNI